MKYVEFDMSKPLDFIPIGRIAIDFNPTDMYMPLSESSNFNKYVGGSPANIAVGLARLGCKVGFCGCVSNDQFGDFVVNYFEKEGIEYFSDMLNNQVVFITLVDNSVVGYLAGSINVESSYVTKSLAELDNMFILENYRKYGIGTKLVNEFKKYCLNIGIQEIKVTASTRNNNAIKFYKNNGFEDFEVTFKMTLK